MTDLQKAAERLLRWAERHADDPAASALARAMIHDVGTVSRAIVSGKIAANPADDAEPISEDWLRSVGFDDVHRGTIANYLSILSSPLNPDADIVELRIQEDDLRTDVWVVSLWQGGGLNEVEDAVCLTGVVFKTRGAVRRLASALGIILQEKHDAETTTD